MDILVRNRVEVVVDMFAYRLQHAAQTVDELLVGVGTKVELGVALDSYFQRRLLQSEHLLTTVFLQVVLFLMQ